jgi:hypothetical protein
MAIWILSGIIPRRGVESPGFRVIGQAVGYQVRDYEAYILCEVEVTGDLRDAVTRGFRILAGYIFGNNMKKESIPMTTPVGLSDAASEKIPMTAPVSVVTGTDVHTVSFVVPSKYTLETLPAPVDQRVRFRVVPSHQAAALSFSGCAGVESVRKKTIQFQAALERDGVNLGSGISLAQYDPPWSPPFLRRNELIVTIRQK